LLFSVFAAAPGTRGGCRRRRLVHRLYGRVVIEYGRHLKAESAKFAAAISQLDPSTAVPTCPGWTASDLVWHLTEVQMFWAAIVEGRLSDPAEAEHSKMGRPATHLELLELCATQSSRLVRALELTLDSEPLWTWSGDSTAGFVRRRQTHEALIHRLDAEATAGYLTDLDPQLAADGIDEVLGVFVGGIPSWAEFEPDGPLVGIAATDTGHRWTVRLGRMIGVSPSSGTPYDLPAVEATATADVLAVAVEGPAANLDAWLWGRGPIERLTVDGAVDAALALRAIVEEATQ